MVEIFDSNALLNMVVILIAIVLSAISTYIMVPPIIRKMRERGVVGIDWNKKEQTEIPELGGIAVLFGFPVGVSIATGVLKLIDVFPSAPILAAIGVLFMGGMIGIIDDISEIPKRLKIFACAFAALPLMLAGYGDAIIEFPFNFNINLSEGVAQKFYWLIVVPIAITGASNAMNMSAGYNGLETGQVAIISFSLLVAAMLTGKDLAGILIFSALFGAVIGLNFFNGYPALIFVGDVGTLSMGGVIGAGAIIGGLEFVAVIAIAPAFYELCTTIYYTFIKKIDSETRRKYLSRPIIDEEGKLHAPKGAEKFTLSFYILSKKPMKERDLVRSILCLYLISGLIAIALSLL